MRRIFPNLSMSKIEETVEGSIKGLVPLFCASNRPASIVLGNFRATFAVGNNFLQLQQPRSSFPFLSIIFEQNIGLEQTACTYISNTKKSTISQKTSSYANFFINLKVNLKRKIYCTFRLIIEKKNNCQTDALELIIHVVRLITQLSSRMLFKAFIVSLGYLWFHPYLRASFLKVLSFKLFLLADVYNYCEERRIKLLIKVNVLNIEN